LRDEDVLWLSPEKKHKGEKRKRKPYHNMFRGNLSRSNAESRRAHRQEDAGAENGGAGQGGRIPGKVKAFIYDNEQEA